jgi:FAD/FMN-containing dehydrogenase
MPLLRYSLVPLALALTQCASILQTKDMQPGPPDDDDERKQLAIVARAQGLVDAQEFAKTALDDAEAQASSCTGEPLSICSYNNVVNCKVAPEYRSPRDTAELVDLIVAAARDGRRIRPLGERHTANTSICPDGAQPLAVSLENFTAFEPESGPEPTFVRVGAGMGMGDLMEQLLARGLSLGPAVPFYRGVTVGGAVATAAHGSSWTQTSVLSSNILALKLIDGRGREHTLSRVGVLGGTVNEDLWLAALASMGAFGVVTEVTFAVMPAKEARLVSATARDERIVRESTAVDAVKAHIGEGTFGQLLWFPNAKRYLWIRVDERDKPAASAGKATQRAYENAMLSPHLTKRGLRLAQRYLGGTVQHPGNCFVEKIGLRRFARGIVREFGDDTSRRRWRGGSGPLSRMITSEVFSQQAQIPQLDFEFAFPAERAGEIIALAESWFDDNNLCLPLVGVFLRFSDEPVAPTTLIGHSAIRSPTATSSETARVMFFEFVVYAPKHELDHRENSTYLRRYDDFAAVLLRRGGWPHWAKNNAALLKAHAAHDPVYHDRLARFRRVADCLDPEGVFMTDFAVDVGLRSPARPDEAACAALTATPQVRAAALAAPAAPPSESGTTAGPPP